jgi:hypothetical protein
MKLLPVRKYRIALPAALLEIIKKKRQLHCAIKSNETADKLAEYKKFRNYVNRTIAEFKAALVERF